VISDTTASNCVHLLSSAFTCSARSSPRPGTFGSMTSIYDSIPWTDISLRDSCNAVLESLCWCDKNIFTMLSLCNAISNTSHFWRASAPGASHISGRRGTFHLQPLRGVRLCCQTTSASGRTCVQSATWMSMLPLLKLLIGHLALRSAHTPRGWLESVRLQNSIVSCGRVWGSDNDALDDGEYDRGALRVGKQSWC
jgi:hypothetical protein